LVKSRVELGKELTLVLGFERNEPNNSESGARSLTIIRLVLWESQVRRQVADVTFNVVTTTTAFSRPLPPPSR
jgi:hypothetical protein